MGCDRPGQFVRMGEPAMKPAHACKFILLSAFLAVAPAAGAPPPGPSLSPYEETVESTRAVFLDLSRPLAYKYVVDRKAQTPFGYALSHIELYRDAKEFAEKTPAMDLVYALWPFLTNPHLRRRGVHLPARRA